VKPDVRAVAVPGGTVQVSRFADGGSGTPLLFLHGGPGGSCAGFAVFEPLAVGRDLVMFDQLGSATSSWDEGPDSAGAANERWSIGRFCDEVDAVRTACGLDRVILFGHSWGGWLAIEYLCRGTGGVDGVVLADTTAGFPAFAASIARRVATLDASTRASIATAPASADVDGAGERYRSAAIRFYEQFVVRNVPGDDVAATVFDRQRSTEVFQAMQGADELHADGNLAAWDRTADLGSIRIPALVLTGAHDHMDRHCADELVAGIQGARLASFADSSHCPHLEEPAAVLSTVGEWLASLP
jgi:proline iminopeptidase